MQATIEKIGIAVKDRLQALVDVSQELDEAIDLLHERIDMLEERLGFRSPPPQAKLCDCENCRLRWN